MQLALRLDNRPHRLQVIHKHLQRRFGDQGPFLRLDPVSHLVMGLIGVRTHSAVSKAASLRLAAHFGSWERVRHASVGDIQRIIGAVTFSDRKAVHLKAALAMIEHANGRFCLENLRPMSVADGLAWLERLPGVGRKVAAVTLNFSTLCKPALVIDTHHLRVLRRLGLVGGGARIRQAYDTIMPLLPPDWQAVAFDEHHQLMKTLGQSYCRHARPVCRACPLKHLCPSPSSQDAPGTGSDRQA